MNNLTTRKIVLGMLLALVLAFSVQGTADALSLSKRSGDLRTKSVDSSFEITFSVGTKSDTTAIKDDRGKLIDDGATPARIDSSGYLVTEIDGKDYRNTETGTNGRLVPPTPPTPDPPRDAPSGSNYVAYDVYEKISGSIYGDAAYGGTIYANSSKSAYSSRGYPLHYYTPAFDYNHDDNADTADKTAAAKASSQIKIITEDFADPRPKSNRYHYNDEAIAIAISNDDTSIGSLTPNTRLRLKNSGLPVLLKPTTRIANIDGVRGGASLYEMDPVRGLPGSVTLIYRPTAVGTHTITIADVTPLADLPMNASERLLQANITFTLYVVEGAAAQTQINSVEATDEAVYYGGEQPLRLDTYLRFFETTVDADGSREIDAVENPENVELHYQVAEGPGRVYVKTSDEDTTTPTTSLLTSTEAQVYLNMNNGRSVVIASIAGQDPDTEGVSIVFHYTGSRTGTGGTTGGGTTGGGTTGGGTTGGGTTSTGTLTVRPTSITGQPGSQHDITISASSAGVVTVGNLISGQFLSAGGTANPRTSSGTFTSTLTLPTTQDTYNLVVSSRDATETIRVTVSSTAAGTQTGGTLAVRVNPASGAPGTTATVTVTATGDDGNAAANVPVTLRITSGGGTFSLSTVTTGANGIASSSLTRGSTPGIEYFITATATGYTQQSVLTQGERVRITGTAPSSPETRTTGDPDILDIYDGDDQSGAVNSPLSDPLTVEILDADGNPVENVSVRFRVTRGRARISPARPRTDDDGFAETTVTPRSPGEITITATVTGLDDTATFTITAGDPADALVKVSGDGQNGTPGSALANPFVVEVQDEDGEGIEGYRVAFAVTEGGGSLSETSASTNASGRAQTTLTLGSDPGINSVQASVSGVDSVIFNTSIDPKILVAAANRPVMYWIDNGMLYSLAGAKAAKIAEGANGVAVGGGKIYWTSQTSASAGAINSANLDGTDAATLTSIMAVPMGIAVDTAGSKLYWTNTRGRIQSANLDGSSIQNVMQNLTAPTDIVVSNGFIYWTEGGNSVRRVNISGQKIAIDVAVNLETVGGLAVGSGKVYWTEMTSATAGTVNGSNLNGTNFETLATLQSAPMGISVDTAGSKLYWTNARGRVQSANLNGSMIKNVVEGLISPSKLAIGGANTATTTTAKKATSTAKKDNAAYDVNGDGAVDNTDASLVAAAMNTSNTKYDVNGDGTVNFLDLLLVFDNRDDTAAAAPTVVGMKLSAVQIDVIEEQIDLLIATNDRSPAALRTLVYLQQLLVTARPEKTQLFANYPNPFNPETWIPYELATDTHVTITIYNTQGVVIRTLQFGHQSAGYYTDRDRAAYWDGRNALGEQVASGLYFYQLETDEMSSMRKMVILK